MRDERVDDVMWLSIRMIETATCVVASPRSSCRYSGAFMFFPI